jgi:Rab GDP dissociation inhibitor
VLEMTCSQKILLLLAKNYPSYPIYILNIFQGFARLSAIYGGTYMLHKPIDKVEAKDDGMIYVTSEGETVKAKQVIGDPSYFPER